MTEFKVGDEVTVRRGKGIERITKISRETKLYVFIPVGSTELKLKKSDGTEPGGFRFYGASISPVLDSDRDELEVNTMRHEVRRKLNSWFGELSINQLKAINNIINGSEND